MRCGRDVEEAEEALALLCNNHADANNRQHGYY